MKLPKLKYYYHATTVENADKILKKGFLVPQEYKSTGTSPGVFFANSPQNAGHFLKLRGHDQYVVFKVPRERFKMDHMFPGGADKFPKQFNMLCVRYLGLVAVSRPDMVVVNDNRQMLPPGVEIVTSGTNKIGMKIVDMEAFEAFIEANPEIKKMVEQAKQEITS
jgi:hypothetical protein